VTGFRPAIVLDVLLGAHRGDLDKVDAELTRVEAGLVEAGTLTEAGKIRFAQMHEEIEGLRADLPDLAWPT
jgi:hypothetical protein